MRLIDADATPDMGISNFSVMFRKVIDSMPTVDRWHYPSRGEYPPDGKDVAIWFDEVPASTSTHFYKWCKGFFNSLTKEWHGDYKGCPCRLTGVKVICWQYIVPPKEEA